LGERDLAENALYPAENEDERKKNVEEVAEEEEWTLKEEEAGLDLEERGKERRAYCSWKNSNLSSSSCSTSKIMSKEN